MPNLNFPDPQGVRHMRRRGSQIVPSRAVTETPISTSIFPSRSTDAVVRNMVAVCRNCGRAYQKEPKGLTCYSCRISFTPYLVHIPKILLPWQLSSHGRQRLMRTAFQCNGCRINYPSWQFFGCLCDVPGHDRVVAPQQGSHVTVVCRVCCNDRYERGERGPVVPVPQFDSATAAAANPLDFDATFDAGLDDFEDDYDEDYDEDDRDTY